MFLRNCWYAAAWPHEVGRTPLARTFLDEPVVLYRAEDGAPVALEDRCCHRSLPLSLGRLTGDGIECGYHGLVFAGDGECVRIPGQSTIPPDARITAYPVIERLGWVWIWMGDPALADADLLPDWWWMDHSEWKVVRGDPPFHVKCNYLLINDNLLDLTHVTFVHGTSIGTTAVAEAPIRTERGEDRVHMTRWILDSPPPPMYRTLGGFTGNVDRWQIVESVVPGYTDVFAGCAVAGTGAPDGDRSQGIEFHNANAVTPETATTTHYFYAHARKFALDDAAVDEAYRRDFRTVFLEDIVVFDAQQASLDREPDRPWVDITVDGPGLAIRRMVDERIALEQG